MTCILLMNVLPTGVFASEDASIVAEVTTPAEPKYSPTPTPEVTETPVANSLSVDETVPGGVTAEASEPPVEDEIVETESPQDDADTESAEDLTEAEAPDSTKEDAEETPSTYTKEEVQALINTLPTVEEISDWPIELQKSSYDHFVEVTDAFYSLSFEEQEQIDMTRMIDLSVFYNSATSMAATLYYQKTWHKEEFTSVTQGSWTDNTGATRSWYLGNISCHWIYDTSEGHACYCIRPDMGECDYYYYYSSGSGTNAWYKQLTEAQRNLIRLILLYGYPNCVNSNNHTHNSAHCQAATQMLIHETVSKCLSSTAPYFHNSKKFANVLPSSSADDSWYKIYWNILGRIRNEGWLPSWMYGTQTEADAAPIELSFNEDSGLYEAVITNTATKVSTALSYTGMLSAFTYNTPEGITVTRDTSVDGSNAAQTVTITATPEAMADGKVTLDVTTPYMVHASSASAYPATVWIYARYSEQWSSWYQPMIQVASVQTDKVHAYMTLRAEAPTGTLEIIKTADDGNISGIAVTVTNDDTGGSQTAATDAAGHILLTLAPGTYTVTESVPESYVCSSGSQTAAVVSGESTAVEFCNTLKRFRVEIIKMDQNTGHAQGDGTLAGAVFGIYHGSELIDTYTTNAYGSIVTDYYPCGNDWSIKEISAPPGYLLQTTSYGLNATPDRQSAANRSVMLTVSECPIMGRISVTKTAHNSVSNESFPETGAVFRVYLKSAGSYEAAKETERDILTIGDNGTATSKELPYGTYIVYQVSGWDGYSIDSVRYELSITEDGETVSVESVNEIFKGSLSILKQDKHTLEPLAGATFRVMNEDGFIVAEATTGEDGTVTFENLAYGNYTYKESKAPEGYQLDETVYDFSITENGQAIAHTRDNCRIPGSITVHKTDSSDQPLSGATYLLEYSTDKGKTWTPVFTRDGDNVTEGGCTSPNLRDGKLTTGSDGTVTFTGLRADENIRYRLTETKAPDGYSLLDDSIYEGSLPVESDGEMLYDISATVRDGIITDLPMTGGHAFPILTLAVILALLGLILILTERKRTA